jgi:indolepyruvate decarboxylase
MRFNEPDRGDFASMFASMVGDGPAVQTRAQRHDALQRAQATRGRFRLLDIRLAPSTAQGLGAHTNPE